MTPDTALRLSKAFGTTPAYWMNMQVHHDLVEVRQTTDVSGIEPLIAA
jgi:addiction module HigA family antidote